MFLHYVRYFAVIVVVTGCATAGLYDNRTADRLASLGFDMLAVYNVPLDEPSDEARVEMIRARLRALHDYEMGRPDLDSEMIKTVETLQILFERHMTDRKAQKWTKEISADSKVQASILLLRLIKTEEGKPKAPTTFPTSQP